VARHQQARQNPHEFIWHAIASVDQLAAARRAAMDAFLDDFEAGAEGRYVDAELPELPFPDTRGAP
jgi:hypothetical protein